MARWTIDEPTTLDFDGVVALKVTLVAGAISVLASDDRPGVQITDVTGPPLGIRHEAGMLEITQENLLDGVLRWLRSQEGRATVTVTVPRECPVRLNLVTADAVITGLNANASIKTASGDVTLDGLAGRIDVTTVAGAVEAQGLTGSVAFNSVSGDLSLAGGSLERLTARTVSGRIAADIDLVGASSVQVNTVSGEVALRLSRATSAEVNLHSASGRIETSFDGLAGRERTAARAMAGTLGEGAGRLTVGTVSGGITLLSRSEDDRPGDGTDAKEPENR